MNHGAAAADRGTCPTRSIPRPVDRGITRLLHAHAPSAAWTSPSSKTASSRPAPRARSRRWGRGPTTSTIPTTIRRPIDLPGLELLGERQEKFLRAWTQDWTGARDEVRALADGVLRRGAHARHSATTACSPTSIATAGRRRPATARWSSSAARWAVHLCGDQHLAVVVKHGIREFGDGPYGFTSPALVNTIYGRWWHPLDEKPGPNPVPGSPLPWTGDFQDGLGNKISMLAYANPEDIGDEKTAGRRLRPRAVRQDEAHGSPSNAGRVSATRRQGDEAQFPGWPITVAMDANDGRKVAGYLPELVFEGGANPVVQVIEEDDRRHPLHGPRPGGRFQPRVYSAGKHTVKIGRDRPDVQTLTGLEPDPEAGAGRRTINL